MRFVSNCIEDTQRFAEEFAEYLSPGDILALKGDLGAGKTAFTAGLAKGLGSANCVSSPTFTIINEYSGGRLPVYHFDLYRLSGADDLYDIGVEDYLFGDGICVVEWPEIAEELVDEYYNIEIRKDLSVSEDYRVITVEKVKKK